MPPQSPPIFHLSRNTALNAGTNFSLTCLIAPNTTGVDTAFTVQSTVTGPQTSNSERVAVSQLTPVGGETVYKVSVIFRYLIEADSGSYTCTALLTSAQDNVVASDSVSALKSITIGCELATTWECWCSYPLTYFFSPLQLFSLPQSPFYRPPLRQLEPRIPSFALLQ